MIFDIRFTPEAEETYELLSEQLYTRWGKKFVDEMDSRISKCLDMIAHDPHMYPVDQDTLDLRKCVLHKNYSMYYRVHQRLVHIVMFWDNRQDPIFGSD